MTDTIEQKALALLNEVAEERGRTQLIGVNREGWVSDEALCRAIEQHEAFRQEVSDAVTDAVAVINNSEALVACEILERFIIWKPDPLIEVFRDMDKGCPVTEQEYADQFRAAIEKRGGKIVWGEG